MNTTNFNQALSKLILSASGWRGIFAKSGEEEDNTTEITAEHKAIAAFMAQAYVDFIKKTNPNPKIALGFDARPTGPAIADSMLRVLLANNITTKIDANIKLTLITEINSLSLSLLKNVPFALKKIITNAYERISAPTSKPILSLTLTSSIPLYITNHNNPAKR